MGERRCTYTDDQKEKMSSLKRVDESDERRLQEEKRKKKRPLE